MPSRRRHLAEGQWSRRVSAVTGAIRQCEGPGHCAGMIAADVLRGDMPLSHLDTIDRAFLLDVTEPAELAVRACRARSIFPWGSSSHQSAVNGLVQVIPLFGSGSRPLYTRTSQVRVLSDDLTDGL